MGCDGDVEVSRARECRHGISPKYQCVLCEQTRHRSRQAARQRALRMLAARHKAEFERLLAGELGRNATA